MKDVPETGSHNSPEASKEKAEGIEPKILKEKAEAVLIRLGYKRFEGEGGLVPFNYKTNSKVGAEGSKRASTESLSEKKSDEQFLNQMSDLSREIVIKQSRAPINFAECMFERSARFMATTSVFASASKEVRGKESLPEFDENLLRVLGDFDEETIYDFLITVREYAAYAENVPGKVRDSRMRLWEQIAYQNLITIEKMAVLYANIRNLRLWEEKKTDMFANDYFKKSLPGCLDEIKQLMGTEEDGKTVVKLKIWNPKLDGVSPRTIEKTIVVDESLFTSSDREEDRNLLEAACRQIMRSLSGGGVAYDLKQPEGVSQEIDEKLKARNVREHIAKLLATLIVGTPAKSFEIQPAQVRMPHAMYGKLLMGHLGIMETEGMPKFDAEHSERVPVELEKLAAIRNGIKKLSEAQEENAYYTMSLLLHQTVDLMSPSTKPMGSFAESKASAKIESGSLARPPLAPETREGITVDQPGDNIEALGRVLDISDNGLSRQLAVVESTEKNIDAFMSTKLAKYEEILNEWKVPLMKYLRYAPPNFVLSKLFPDFRVAPETEKLIIELKQELDSIRKRNEQLKKNLGTMREALIKAVGALREERRGLMELQKQRKQFLEDLHKAKNEQERQFVTSQLQKNAEEVRSREAIIEKANKEFCTSLVSTTKASLAILEEAQVSDNFYTARSKVSLTAFLVSAALFAEWASSYRGTYWLGRGIGYLGPRYVPGVNTIAYRTWQIGRRIGLGPEVVYGDAKYLVKRTVGMYADKTLFGARSAEAVEFATGAATIGERIRRGAELGITTKRYSNLGIAIEKVHELDLPKLRDAYRRMGEATTEKAAKQIFKDEVAPILRKKIAELENVYGLNHVDASKLVRRGICGLETAEMDLLAEGGKPWNFARELAALEEAGTGGTAVAARTAPVETGTVPKALAKVAPKEIPGRSGAVASAESAETRVAGEALTAERAAKFKLNAPQLRTFGGQAMNATGMLVGAAVTALEVKATVDSYKDMKTEVKHLESVKAQIIAELDSLTTGENPLLKVIGDGAQKKYEFNGILGVSFSIGQIAELHNVTDAQINGWLNVSKHGASTIFFAAATLGAVSGGVALAAIPVIIAVDVGINFAKNSIAAQKRRQMLEQAPAWLLSYLGTAGVLGMSADQAFQENAGSKKANREKLLAIMAYNSAFRASHGNIIHDLPNLGDPSVLLNPNGEFLREGGDFQKIVRRFAVLRLVQKKRTMLVGKDGLEGKDLLNAVRIEDVESLDPESTFPRAAKSSWDHFIFSPEEREEALREGMMFYIQYLREIRYKERRAAIIEKTSNDKDRQKQALEAFDAEVEKNKDQWFVFGKHPKDLNTAGSPATQAIKMLNDSEAKADNPDSPLGAGKRDNAEHNAFNKGAESVRTEESEIARPVVEAERMQLEPPAELHVYRTGDALPDKRLYTGQIFKGWLRNNNSDLAVFDFRHPVQGDGGPLIATVTSFDANGKDRSKWTITEKRDEYFDWGRQRHVAEFKGTSKRVVPFEKWAKEHPLQTVALEAEFQHLDSIGAEHDAKKKPAEDEQEFMKKLKTLPNFDDREGKILERAKAMPRLWHKYENRPGVEREYDYVACIPGTDFEPAYYLYLKMPKVPVRQLSMSAPGTSTESPKEEEYQGEVVAVMRENKTGFVYDVSGNYRQAFQGRGNYGPQIADGLGFPIIGDDEGSAKKVLAPYVKRIDQADAQTMIEKALEFYVTLPVSDAPTGGKLPKREQFLRLLDSHLSRSARVEGEPGSYYYIQPEKFKEALEGAIKATGQ